ncbi:unnamed protein product [Lactuca saligna]|uniref:SWIM-type domain-containing protein n=1 Tax=Lactuca saligna TaxID=75948 RepID=A0AA36A3B4_LACSI|nr:unnamed protein product [Lactuca saligna]
MKNVVCGDFYGDECYFNSMLDIGDEDEDNSTKESEGGYEDTSDENESDNESGQSLDDCDGTKSDENESVNNSILYSPGGSNQLWKPSVTKELIPDDQVTFKSLTHAINMYRKYAEHAGFDVRLNTTTRFRHEKSIIKIKYVVCNRAGKIPDRSLDTMDTNNGGRKHRNSNFIVTNCKSLIKFERVSIGTNEFQIREFQELHNHPLYTIEERRHSKKARKLNYADKEFIICAATTNVGATKAHKLRATLKGNKDAQLILNKMNERKTYYPDYSFEYKCVDSVLNAMFWADETDKVFYKEFGVVISFDTTFRSNKYGMVFVPFTTIDNHKRFVTVGASLLSNEKIESYCLLLEAFLKARGKESTLVLTDQDLAILQAVEAVSPNAKHRLCLWHITKKLEAKIVMITHLEKRRQVKTKCKVELKLLEKDVKCICELFKQMGILCRHVFAVLKNNHIEEIPEQYIMRRWRRDIISSHLLVSKNGLAELEDETFKLLIEAYSNLEYCLERLQNDKDKLEEFMRTTRTMRKVFKQDSDNTIALDESDEAVFRLFGVIIPEQIEVNVPPMMHNKGSGTKKRMVSAAERAVASSKSGSRKCTGCNLYVNHNWRTCKVRIAREKSN